MVDLHCHILPGLDDGPATIEESLEMAQSAVADGITRVVATPHSNNVFSFDYARVRDLRDQLQSRVGERLTIATGCDFHVDPENLEALRKDGNRFCINQRNYLLVEFNDYSIPTAMDQVLHDIRLSGLRPIVTHPERNAILRAQPERLAKWVKLGCFAQVTGGALTGVFGTGAQEDALRWIAEGLIHFVASDAHNTRGRPLKLRAAFDKVSQQFGKEKAAALFVENPMAAFDGGELPHVPEPLEEPTRRRRRRFLFF